MKRLIRTIVLFLVSLLVVTGLYGRPDANTILSKSDDRIDMTGALIKLEMKVYRKGRLRKTYRMTSKTSGIEKSLIEFTYPPRNKGQKVLRLDNNMWIYRPKINKTIRVSGRSNTVGSDFSNTDILSVRLDRDYTASLLGVVDYNGTKAYKLELRAKTEDVTYASIIYWIRAKDYFPLQRDYYTVSGHKLKTLVLERTSSTLGEIPDTLTMTNVMEKNKKSVLHYKHIQSNVTFPGKIFRKSSLKRAR